MVLVGFLCKGLFRAVLWNFADPYMGWHGGPHSIQFGSLRAGLRVAGGCDGVVGGVGSDGWVVGGGRWVGAGRSRC